MVDIERKGDIEYDWEDLTYTKNQIIATNSEKATNSAK